MGQIDLFEIVIQVEPCFLGVVTEGDHVEQGCAAFDVFFGIRDYTADICHSAIGLIEGLLIRVVLGFTWFPVRAAIIILTAFHFQQRH